MATFKKKSLFDVLKQEKDRCKKIITDKYAEGKEKLQVDERLDNASKTIEGKLEEADNYVAKKKEELTEKYSGKKEEVEEYLHKKSGKVVDDSSKALDGAADYVNTTKDNLKKKYDEMDPEKKKDLKQGAAAATVAVVATNPLLWIPAGYIAYKKGKKIFAKKKTPKDKEDKTEDSG